MEIENKKIGDFTIKDLLLDIKSVSNLTTEYEEDVQNMIDKIDHYLNIIEMSKK